MLNMLQAAGLGPSPTNTGPMNNPTMTGIPAITIPKPSTGTMIEETLLQQVLSAAAPSGLNSNPEVATLHGHHIEASGGLLSQAHQAGKNRAIPPMSLNARPDLPPLQDVAADENDRALGLSFEERVDYPLTDLPRRSHSGTVVQAAAILNRGKA